MKKLFEEDDHEQDKMERARILMAVIPVVLILLILAFMLIKSRIGQGREDKDDLQQSIMDYADEKNEAQAGEQTLPADSSSVSTAAPGADPEGAGEGDNASPPAKENEEPAAAEDKNETGEGLQSQPGRTATPTPYKEVMETGKKDYSKITFHKEEQLGDMMAYWADNNQKALDDLAYLDHFIAMSYSLRGTTDFYYYGDQDGNGTPNGKGIAVYADNQYYYGDWKNGLRSGNGTWIHYHIHLTENKGDLYTYHQYTGGWAGDLPEGEGSEHYDYDKSLLQANTSYVANRIGSYAKGLVNGEFYMTSICQDESSSEWNAEAKNGVWNYLSDTKDKKGNRTVYVDVHDPNNYTWMHPRDNSNIGVPCLLSKNRDKNGVPK